ncbi:MAG: hypothetical protein FP825_10325 [Hyphomonas sp.]|uniref:hypothetical protein n=1 Tax=Hyphomonas sp. TaxID=87 RepID=UPI00184F99F7|nr:hypothetical protein [Hyphomonas sp.]MBA3068865.1 hypothetical protein [Hyphomonas sp.]MBU3922240.1 hypothetical protein [Alphaproteobacteria bacterium]MBU4062923.1 hypothetical protein [Alphaproteobacteria bacterium]MBU4165455.1 hypothetical protein [Alphaproteobacteria bacterium]
MQLDIDISGHDLKLARQEWKIEQESAGACLVKCKLEVVAEPHLIWLIAGTQAWALKASLGRLAAQVESGVSNPI